MKFEYLHEELGILERALERNLASCDEDFIRADIYHLKKRIESLNTAEGLKVEIDKLQKQYEKAMDVWLSYRNIKNRKKWEDKEMIPLLNAIEELKAELDKMS